MVLQVEAQHVGVNLGKFGNSIFWVFSIVFSKDPNNRNFALGLSQGWRKKNLVAPVNELKTENFPESREMFQMGSNLVD